MRGKFRNKKAILFDLDGTLINSLPDLTLAINQMLVKLNRNTIEQKIALHWIGNGVEKLVRRALEFDVHKVKENYDPLYVRNAITIYADCYRQIPYHHTFAYPGVINGLKKLKSTGFQLAVITNKSTEFIQPILDKLKFVDNNRERLFDFILGGDTLPRKKPDPLPLRYTCNELKVEIRHCIMVGDSKNDILAANDIGMDNIAVTYGYNYGECIKDCEPGIICSTFDEVINLILPYGAT